MTSINIDSDNEQDLKKIRELALQNGWLLSYSKPAIDTLFVTQKQSNRLKKLLDDYSKNGGLKSFGDNPSEWQTEQRTDKVLPGR